jgi:Fe-Mn family superoxide dismutase
MTKQFQEKKFNVGKLVGISEKTTEEHLKLYAGYVKNANTLLERNAELSLDLEKNSYLIGELFRRFSFEYNGMRNHEVYFDSLSDGAKPLDQNGALHKALLENFGLIEHFLGAFKFLAMTRGIGWAMLWYDKKDERLLASWVDEQHLGQLSGCAPILTLDMWEHSYVADYQPSGKKKYIEDFFANLNWGKVENNFETASK